MQKKIIIILIISGLFCLPQLVTAKPRAGIDNPVYTFSSVPEGVLVPHVFILKNTGDTLLHIENVLPP